MHYIISYFLHCPTYSEFEILFLSVLWYTIFLPSMANQNGLVDGNDIDKVKCHSGN